MSEIRMTGEIRTDYDCEATGMPAERWGEAVFKVGDDEIILEVSAEENTIVAIMVNEDTAWKGTLEGLKNIIARRNKRAIKGAPYISSHLKETL